MNSKTTLVRVAVGLSIGLSVGLGTGGGDVASAHGKSTVGVNPAGHGHYPMGHSPTADGGRPTSTVAPSPTTTGDTQGSHGRKGGVNGASVSFTGHTTCSVRGKLTFAPPLVRGGASTSTVTVTGLLSRCSTKSQGHVKVNNGHLSALVGTITSNDCASLPSVVAPPLAGGLVVWTPPAKVMASGDLSMPAGTASAVAGGRKSVLQISYVGGSVASGSFAGVSNSSLMVTSVQDTAQLSERCAHGLTNLAFSGHATL